MITRPGYHLFEYTLETKVPQRSSESNLTETVISVFFDRHAQQLFSSVRIHIGHELGTNRSLAICIANKWKFARGPLVIDRTPSAPLDAEVVGSNPSSLPALELYYRKSLADGALTLEDLGSRLERPLLEIDQPLTADTQSVSVSFMSAPYLSSAARGNSNRPLGDAPSTATRVLRVQLPIHKTICLPTEVLSMIFRILSESFNVCSLWRRALFSCGLVCKQWSFAFASDLMLSDFRYPDAHIRKTSFPPEIASFANALVLRPNLALSIGCVSPEYFLKHECRKNLSFILEHSCQQLFRPRRDWEPSLDDGRREFIKSFLNILQLAKNVRAISLPFCLNQDIPSDYVEALRELDKVEEADVTASDDDDTTAPELAADLGPGPVPTTPPQYSLARATLRSFNDQELNYVLSTSSTSLEWLRIINPNFLTSRGLSSALEGVCKSLVSLRIGRGATQPAEEDDWEHALDAHIDKMDRLEYLAVTSDNATHLMIERRAEAFVKRSFPTVKLRLEIPRSQGGSLREAAEQFWSGWEITLVEL
ncbi:hypothetical protein JVU11DRAFT_7530 [Chiua virens]|nr:hypothetical protein JVU11DRAFT_7530 [Chiua virens]